MANLPAMRTRLALILTCALTVLGVFTVPALGAKDHGSRTATTTTRTSTTTPHTKTTKSKATKSKTAAAAGTAGVSVASATAVLNDCNAHGELTHQYSRAQIKKALAIMSSATSQYSDCSDVLHNALAHNIAPADVNGSGGSGSSTTTIVIIVVVVLLLLAAIFGGLVIRRRRGGGGTAA